MTPTEIATSHDIDAIIPTPTLEQPARITDDVHLVRFRCPLCRIDGQGQLVRGILCASSQAVVRCLDCGRDFAVVMVEV